jgi:hypothetical protein
MAGCILGASMPYRHPVGVTISLLWWGFYLGCFGACLGAGVGGLFGLRSDHTPASPPRTEASEHRSQVQRGTEAVAVTDQNTSPVVNDRGFETFIGGTGI